MKIKRLFYHLLFGLFLAVMFSCKKTTTINPEIPHLRKQGTASQLIVDGKPFLVLAGEVANTASSDLEYMNTVWPNLKRMNFNTVLVAIAWAWVEPEENKFDFSLVDGLIKDARANDLRIIFLWFGSWKNGISSFVPSWVKENQEKYPRVQIKSGKSIEVLSTFSKTNMEYDTRAYTAFMKHIREVDSEKRTVIMIQLQNEVGILGDSRDRCAEAEKAFHSSVPDELMDYLQNKKDSIMPELLMVWGDAGFKTNGTWQEVFGKTPATDEIFMAWNYSQYMNIMAAAGKAEYPLPVFTNSWIVQPGDKGPGDYPSGGPEPLTISIWKAGAPGIDINAPDIYLPNFDEWAALFNRYGNPLFVPESRGDITGAANAFYAIGQHDAIGYSAMGVDNTARFVIPRPDASVKPPEDLEELPLAKAYKILRQLSPVILEHQGKGTIAAAWLNSNKQTQDIYLGNYKIGVERWRNRRNPEQVAELGYGIFIATGPDEYLVSGYDIRIIFTPVTPGDPIAGLSWVEAGRFDNGQWIPERKLSGDDILLRYDLGAAADVNQSGSGLQFRGFNHGIQRVKIYRYK
ncbi:MAG: DUF5597 domain-containing protein [Bacteroidales bacterium]|nr:DUF5597 domain-containing protein [Bacteroidales bacterium]